jgi:ornithine carbamoyltransferase
MKDLLRTADLSATGLERVLSLSAEAKEIPHHWRDTLEGDTVVLYFAKPSTRTRISFETAVTRLGGTAISVDAGELQLGRGETVEDTAKVISRFARAFVIRTFDHDDVRRFAAAASIPVVNALTDVHHPCQSLADLLTLRQRFESLRGLKVAFLGDGNNVAHSLMEACALAGVDVAIATPPGFEPAPDVVRIAERLSLASGSLVWVTHDPLLAVAGANAVYTDVWMSMGVPESERAARVQAFTPYRVTRAVMAEADPSAVFLHCLPAHRGEEVSADVIDGPRSLVFDQAENRLHTATGLLRGLLTGEIEGAADRSVVSGGASLQEVTS